MRRHGLQQEPADEFAIFAVGGLVQQDAGHLGTAVRVNVPRHHSEGHAGGAEEGGRLVKGDGADLEIGGHGHPRSVDLRPSRWFTAEQIRKGLPELRRFGLSDLRGCG